MRAILILLALLAVPALAADATSATPGLHAFTPPANDISVGFLRQVFGSIVDGAGTGDGMSMLGAMMGVFNLAILFLAMIFVCYTTIKGTIDSAHDGVMLGKQMSEIYVPLRTVGGTALLLPLASGFSLLQGAVIWLAMQGVGVANQAWTAGIDRFTQTGTLGRVSVPDARPLAANILRAEVCMAAMNAQFEASDRKTRITILPLEDVGQGNGAKATRFRWGSLDYQNPAVCGSVSWVPSAADEKDGDATRVLRQPILDAHTNAVWQMVTDLRPVARQIVAWKKPAPGALDQAAARYEDALAKAAKAAVDASPDVGRQAFLDKAREGGWVLAGTWYSHMVKVNDSIQAAVNTVPASTPVRIEDLEVKETLQTYRDAIAFTDEYMLDRSAAPRQAFQEMSIEDAKNVRSVEDVWRLLSIPAMKGLEALTDRIAGANTAPVEQLRVLGNDIVLIGAGLKAAYFAIAGFAGSRLASITVGNVFDLSEALRTINGTVEWTSSALWALGAMLAFYLPAVPTIWWVAGVIRWLASVAEAVLAAPLMAAMHVHPGGDDLVGRAGPGYMLILAMVIQPALLVLGLVLSAALLYPAGALVNMVFLGMVSGVTGSNGVGLIALVAWVALYVGMMTMAIHACFALISSVPDNVMRWVGSQAGAQGVGIKEVEKTTGGLEQGSKGAGQGASGSKGAASPKGAGAGGKSGGEANGFSNAELLPDAQDRQG
ncbi:DotA/TraY family protein [Azospira sp. I09]|jgi:conjugal transfer/type IV secretion protein DotA/TraY|uniref:DotA/TraY family protein n=1 Tax=Azospira sp. I09 TaxID=1765049 RepID=UPI0012A0E5D1|nr:DotA/TraY family protein [Azospira sp. I09]BBN88861.1 DotA protein [Azospira sp. I09]